MIKMTFDDYDGLLERFESLHTPTYYPSPSVMELFESNSERWLVFACYLYEFGKKPQNKTEEYSRKTLREFIDNNLELCEEECMNEKFDVTRFFRRRRNSAQEQDKNL